MSGRHGRHAATSAPDVTQLRPPSPLPSGLAPSHRRPVDPEPLASPAQMEPDLDPDVVPDPVAPPETEPEPGGRSRRRAARADRKRRRGRRTRRLIAGLLLLAVLAAAAVAVLARDRSGTPDAGDAGSATTTTPARGRTQTTLLLQLRADSGDAAASALFAHDTSTGKGAALLIPSRLLVDIPGAGSGTFGEALGITGPTRSADALRDALDVRVDSSWVLDRTGLAALVDAVHGVAIDGSAGEKTVSGKAAVAYVAAGAGEPPAAALARFQRVLAGVLAALPTSSSSVASLVRGLGAHARASVPMADLASFLTGLSADTAGDAVTYDVLPTRAILTGATQKSFGLDESAAARLMAERFEGSRPETPVGGRLLVYVQNGVGTPGLGERARARLVAAKFEFSDGGNIDGFAYRDKPSVVLVPDRSSRSGDRGRRVAEALGLPDSAVQATPGGQTVADVIVILGKDFAP